MQLKTKTRIYIGILVVVLIICVVVSIWTSFFRNTSTNTDSNFEKLNLQGFNNYTYTSDYTWISEDTTIDKVTNNYYYKPKNLFDKNNIKQGALKLGLSNEAFNESRNFTAWTKQGVNQLDDEYISYEENKAALELFYKNGINSSPVEPKDSYNYLTEFFGLPKNEVIITNNQKFGTSTVFVTFSVKVMGKSVAFSQADPNLAVVGMKDGKIIQFFTYILPSEFDQQKELKPITKITKSNISDLFVQATFKPDNPTGASAFGSSFSISPPAKIGYRKYDIEYVYHKDTSYGFVLLPTIKVTGIFSDNNDIRGEALLFILNQEP